MSMALKTQEISNSKLVREAQFEQYFDSFLEALPLGVIWLDAKGCIQNHNQLAGVLLGCPDMAGKPWREICSQELVASSLKASEALVKNGRTLDISTQAVPSFQNPHVLAQLILLNDVTQSKKLKQQQETDRFRELGVLSATLSHQLKTPLATATLYANQLHDYEMSSDRRKRASEQVMTQLNYMNRQVTDLLFFVKGDLPVEQTHTLGDLIKSVLQTNKASLKGFKFQLQCSPDLAAQTLTCHFDAVVGALSNLVVNACEASTVSQSIEIRVNQLFDKISQKGFFTFDVSDQGCGFDSMARQFIGVKAYTSKSKGTGLGLRFVKTVAEKHGGDLRFCQQQIGSCVGFSLPMRRFY